MFMQPLRNSPRKQQVSEVASRPAPVKGWNARDGLAMMKAGDAVVLDNYFPNSGGCDLRGGTARDSTITGVTDAPETLMVYASGAADKMLACAEGAIYDVTAGGTIGSALSSGYSNNRFSYDHMGGYIVAVNGADTPIKYEGTTISTTAITGVTSTNLNYVCAVHNRLFFVEKNTLSAWYLGALAIAGAATEMDLSGYCSLGGKLVAIGRWTRDGGSGMDDMTVFITNKGEVLVYQGNDPDDATTWSQVGVFRIGAPIGSRPILKNGADLIIITEDGYIPLSKALPIDRVGAEKYAISDNIRDAVSTATRTYSSNYGWQAVLYPKGHFALFNIPTREGELAEQHIINTITFAWCKFKGINAVCWEVFNGGLYFGAKGGFVCLADTQDFKDDTLETVQDFAVIQGDIIPAYDYFGSKAQLKKFDMVRPIISSNGTPIVSMIMNVDFERGIPTEVDSSSGSGTPWGSPWGSPWGGAIRILKNWLTATGLGYCAAPHIRTRTSGMRITLNSLDYTFKRGGVL